MISYDLVLVYLGLMKSFLEIKADKGMPEGFEHCSLEAMMMGQNFQGIFWLENLLATPRDLNSVMSLHHG